MITKNTCLGFELNVTTPDTVEDFDKIAGKPGAALGEAVKNVIYRSWNAAFRRAFLERVEKETGIKWPVDQKKTDAQPKPKSAGADWKPTEVYMQEGDYLENEVIAKGGFTRDQLKPFAEEEASKIDFDPSATERTGGKVAKEFLNAADTVLSKDKDGVLASVAKLEQLNPGLKIDIDGTEKDADGKDVPSGIPSRETLAKAIRTNHERKVKESVSEFA